MDKADLKILECLKANGRASIKEIAKSTGIPMATVHYRLKNMEKQNALKFTAKVNRKFTGKELIAYVMVKVMAGFDHEKVFNSIMARGEVEEGAVVTGEFDLLFKVSVANMNELNDFVIKYLRVHKNIAETRTMICYDISEK